MKKIFFSTLMSIMMLACAAVLSSCEDNSTEILGGGETEIATKQGLTDVYGKDCRYAGKTDKTNFIVKDSLVMNLESKMVKTLELSYVDASKDKKVDSTFICKNQMIVENFTAVQVESLSDVEGKTFEIKDGAFRPGKSVMPVKFAEPTTVPASWSFTLVDGEKQQIELCKLSAYNGTLAFGKSRQISDQIYKVAVTVTEYAEEKIESIYTDSLLVTESKKDEVVLQGRFTGWQLGGFTYEWQETHTVNTDLNKDWTPANAVLPWTMESSVTPAKFNETTALAVAEVNEVAFVGNSIYRYAHNNNVNSSATVRNVESNVIVTPEAGKDISIALPINELKAKNTAVTAESSETVNRVTTTVYKVAHAIESATGIVVLASDATTTGEKKLEDEESFTYTEDGGDISITYIFNGESFSGKFANGDSIHVTDKLSATSENFVLELAGYNAGSNWSKVKNVTYTFTKNGKAWGKVTAELKKRIDTSLTNINDIKDTNVEVFRLENVKFTSLLTSKEENISISAKSTSRTLAEGAFDDSQEKVETKAWTINYKFGSAVDATAVKLTRNKKDVITGYELLSESFSYDNVNLYKVVKGKEIHQISSNNREYTFKFNMNLKVSNNGTIKVYEELVSAILDGNAVPTYGTVQNQGDSLTFRHVKYTQKAKLAEKTAELYIEFDEPLTWRGKDLTLASVNVNSSVLGSILSKAQEGIYQVSNRNNTWAFSVAGYDMSSTQSVQEYIVNMDHTIPGWRVISGERTHSYYNKTANGYDRVDVLVFAEIGNESHKRIYAFASSTKEEIGHWETSDAELAQITSDRKLSVITSQGALRPCYLTNCTDNKWKTAFAFVPLDGTKAVSFSDATTSLKEFPCPWEASLELADKASGVYSLGNNPKNYYR